MDKKIAVGMKLVVLAMLVVGMMMPQAVTAQTPAVQVIATGLNNPRGIDIGPDGAVYVAEAGAGGEDCVTIETKEGPVVACSGLTGSITRVARGRQARIIKKLPSWINERGEVLGPQDVAFSLTGIRVTIGLGGSPEFRAQIPNGKLLGHVVQFTPARKLKPFVDIAAFEAEVNPEQSAVDSNPYSILNHKGKGILADAGGNALLSIAKNGTVETLAVFPPRIVPAPPIPGLPPEIPMDAVPNAVVVGPDGAYYVGQLTGFPFPVGGANVYRVAPGEEPEVYAEGFTNIIDIGFGPDGSLWVLEIAANSLLSGDPTGALIRVAPDGTRTTMLEDTLVSPTGMVISKKGVIYISNHGLVAGEGELLKVKP